VDDCLIVWVVGKLQELTILQLNDNPLLTGTLPSQLGFCERLGESDVTSCLDVMTISHPSVHNRTALSLSLSIEEIHIRNTQMQGTVPSEVCALRDKHLNSDDPLFQDIFKANCLPNKTMAPFCVCDCCSSLCDYTTKLCLIMD
jgi:hypothetical protein